MAQLAYQLDSLGWMQFEYLVQVLLKAELGVGVEVWGGSADHGKDAFCNFELNFPNKHVTNPGPFVFQAKFISNANSAAAKFENELLAATKKEADLIAERLRNSRWSAAPRYYSLFTNAPVTAGGRANLCETLSVALPNASITIQGAQDICALLDVNMQVVRVFPQILSLRNLTELLENVVRNESIQRSDGAIREAESLAGVFVPTKAYDRTWEILNKHNFVVLEGPPEMGKTAIAWMVAAAQLTQKWEAIDCDSPSDFFKNFIDSKDQIFVADDAFGSTEYDITRGTDWGRSLHKILPKLNNRHWLVWTSRMHILQVALQEMNLQGKAGIFPKPAEVIVNASKLDREEKALILYRHARAASLEEGAKSIIRKNANGVISNYYFTPERIKRFVSESLPELTKSLESGSISQEDLEREINSAIENPTTRMRKAFAKLDETQKWLLIALLDCGRSPDLAELEQSFRRFCEVRQPIAREVEALEESFLERYSDWNGATSFRWVHPSYRDLVIEELEKDETRGINFLRSCSLAGLQLSLSVAGGAKGDRQFPLMSIPKSFDLVAKRLKNLIEHANTEFEVSNILNILETAIEAASRVPTIQQQFGIILIKCCEVSRSRWDRIGKPLPVGVVEAFFDASMCLLPPPPMPALFVTLKSAEAKCDDAMKETTEKHYALEATPILTWARVMKVVHRSDLRILLQSGFPEKYQTKMETLKELIADEIRSDWSPDDPDEVSSEAERFRDLAQALDQLLGIIPALSEDLEKLATSAEGKAEGLDARLQNIREGAEQYSDPPEEYRAPKAPLDIDRLFSDL